MGRGPDQDWAVSKRPAIGAERASVRVLALVLLRVVTSAAWDGTATADSGRPAPTTITRQREGTWQWTNEESEYGDMHAR